MIHEPSTYRHTEEEISRAIELAARRLSAGEVRPGFSSRVVAHLEERRKPGWLRIALPAFAGAAVILAAVTANMLRETPTPGLPPAPLAVAPAVSTTALGVPFAPSPIKSAADRKTAKAESTVDLNGLPALAPSAEITIDSIQPAALVTPQLDVKPLVLAPLVVAPLDERGGGR